MKKPPVVTCLNVWVERTFYQHLKVQAALKGMILKALVIAALKEQLQKP